MRFQTTETVPTPDSEIVLRALETTLPEISSEVVRDGHQIILRGLGPSPRARNPRDITVLHVSSDHATTIINADVSFQASALLGATSQDSIVRSKLDYVFDQVRTQLSLEAERASHSDLVLHSGVFAPPIDFGVVEMPRASMEPVEHPMQPSVAESARTAELGQPTTVPAEPRVSTVSTDRERPGFEPVAETVAAAPEPLGPTPTAESVPAISGSSSGSLVVPQPIESLKVVEKASPPLVLPVKAAVDLATEPAKQPRERPMLQFSSSRPAHRTHVPELIVAIIALLLLFAVAAYYLLRPNPPDPRPTSLPAATQPVHQSSLFRVSVSGFRKLGQVVMTEF